MKRWTGTILLLMAYITTIGAEEPVDRFQWLEDVTGDKPLEWVKRRNAESTQALTQSSNFQELEERLLRIMDSTERIPFISKAGDYYYNFWRDAQNRRGLWRRTSLAEYRKSAPAWETVLDLDKLAQEENENWVWKNVSFLEPTYDRCLISLSRGGADATVVREFDVDTKSFVTNGFVLTEAKNNIAWRNRDSVFVGTDFGPGSMTDSGYPRIVRQWARGTPLSAAVTVYEGKPEDVSVAGMSELAKGFEQDFIHRGTTFWTSDFLVRRGDEWIKVGKPDDAESFMFHGRLFLTLRSDWKIGDNTYPAGSLITAQLADFLAGKTVFDVLFQPTERKSLASFAVTKRHVLVNELDNVRNRVVVLTPEKEGWKRAPLPGAPELSTISVFAVDPESSDDYFMTISGYLTPTALHYGTIGGGGPAERLKQNPLFFKTEGLAVSQHEAVSADGTKIPYFQVGPESLPLEGKAPTLLYGYGGFEIPMVPDYQPTTGAAWLEKGGVYVVANIRGGGEFGPTWHQAALKEHRHRAYEDFIAVAEDLIRRKVTSSEHLGIMGGSNGGLLMGNMLTRRPDLFEAIVCKVPLLDMQRYHKLLAGASWMAEYGNPDVPEEWKYIQTFSPYHNLDPMTKYPRTLFTTSTRDDRVHPGHARKMVALMKDQGHDVLYYENIEGGHGGAADNKQAAFMSALGFVFLWQELAN